MSELGDILQVQGINAKGYGTIAKLAMKDRRLTPIAKTIYSYLCSHAGAGKITFPSRHTIIADLGISMDSYYTHLNKLKELGYIKVTQQRDKYGKFKKSVFTIASELVITDQPCREQPYTEKPCTTKPDIYNKQKEINNKYDNKHLSSQSVSDGQDNDRTDDTVQQIEAYTELIKENIDYSYLAESRPYDMKLVDEMIAIIIDTVMTEGRTVRIGKEDKPRALVTSQLMKLTYSDIELVLDQFKNITDRISKKKQYILTMLYNSKLEGNSHYTNMVKHDMWNQ